MKKADSEPSLARSLAGMTALSVEAARRDDANIAVLVLSRLALLVRVLNQKPSVYRERRLRRVEALLQSDVRAFKVERDEKQDRMESAADELRACAGDSPQE